MREAPTTRIILPRLVPAMVTEMVTAQFGARAADRRALPLRLPDDRRQSALRAGDVPRARLHPRRAADGGGLDRRLDDAALAAGDACRNWSRRALPASIRPTRRILEVAAIIGQDLHLPAPPRRCSTNRKRRCWRGWSRRRRANMIAEDDPAREQYHFTHPIIHEVLYHAVLVTRRRQWHRRIGEAIEAAARPVTRTAYDRLAHHFGQAHDGARAVRYLILAGDAAMRVFARATAAEYYEDALALLGADGGRRARSGCCSNWPACVAYADPLRSQQYAEEALRGFLARGDHFNVGAGSLAARQFVLALRAVRAGGGAMPPGNAGAASTSATATPRSRLWPAAPHHAARSGEISGGDRGRRGAPRNRARSRSESRCLLRSPLLYRPRACRARQCARTHTA